MSEFPLIKQIITETKHETKHEAILQVLRARFGEIPEQLGVRLERITSIRRLDELLRFAAVCSGVEAFQKRLKP